MTETEILSPGADEGAHQQSLVPLQTSAAISAARAEVESSLLIAKRFPRNERDALARLLRAVQREGMATDATYTYPRGKEDIVGPSIYIARQAKICWGNMDAGFRTLERTADETLIEGYAIDRETNATTRYQQRVKNMVQRKVWIDGVQVTKWVEPDERDYGELVGRVGAKLERNAILSLIPQDFIDEALREARRTLRRVADGALTNDRDEVIARLLVSFGKLGVDRDALEARLEHKLEAISAEELAELNAIGKSILSGQASVAEFFSGAKSQDAKKADGKADAVKARVNKAKAEREAPPAPDAAEAPAAPEKVTDVDAAPEAEPTPDPEPPEASAPEPAPEAKATKAPSTALRKKFSEVGAFWMKATDSKEEDAYMLVQEVSGHRTRRADELNADEMTAAIAQMEKETKEALS